MNPISYAAKSQGAQPLLQQSLLHCLTVLILVIQGAEKAPCTSGTIATGEPLLLSESMRWMLMQLLPKCSSTDNSAKLKVQAKEGYEPLDGHSALSFCRWSVWIPLQKL